jgi:DnaJ-class molecular chaperone
MTFDEQEKFNAKIQHKVNECAYKIDKIESMLQAALGPCDHCNGSGMIYSGNPEENMSLPDQCDKCNGGGKIPLDVTDMMERFKKEARDEIESLVNNEPPF